MEEHWMWYLTGMVDSVGVFSGKITKNDDFAIGYSFTPTFSISRNEQRKTVLGMVDEYCEDYGINYRVEEPTDTTSQVILASPDSIRQFIEPLRPGIVQQQKEVEIMFDKILPMVDRDEHTTKEGLYEIAGYLDTLREGAYRGKTAKYTQGYFGNEWSDELF